MFCTADYNGNKVFVELTPAQANGYFDTGDRADVTFDSDAGTEGVQVVSVALADLTNVLPEKLGR